MGFRKSRHIKGKPNNVTVFCEIDHWYVSIQTEIKVSKEPVYPSTNAVEIDLGIKKMIALSDGAYIPPINAFQSAQQKLGRLQRQLSRKVKFSNNCSKLVKKIRKLQWHTANIREDYLQKSSCTLSKNHAIVCIEELSVSSMSRSAKGTIETPGRNVKAKTGLNKAILDQGRGELKRQLGYKQSWRVGLLVVVPRQYTSQQCSECGYVDSDNRPSQAMLHCQAYGHTEKLKPMQQRTY
jgi:putative transposase